MQNSYPKQVVDLRFQVDHINPQTIQPIENYRHDLAQIRIFVIIIRHLEVLPDRNNISQFQVF